ncbi:MAG: formate hydrogenlyase subunit 6/NADH:ubiquinone oxidoreductase subunit I [Candidatus Omnitrophota bacterium]|jgi:formate hydrogenlyase subunit 6/NADH:ubiquinone oxidoreductase subunit I
MIYKYFKNILMGFISLIKGMLITWSYMLKKPVTMLYPKEECVTDRFKGPIQFTIDEQDQNHKCIACNACIKACPSRCMHLDVEKNADGKRVLTDFKVDHMLCSTCSICIDVCPTDALDHNAKGYAEATTTRSSMVHDLIEPFRIAGVDVDRPILTPAQKKALSDAKNKPSDEGGAHDNPTA